MLAPLEGCQTNVCRRMLSPHPLQPVARVVPLQRGKRSGPFQEDLSMNKIESLLERIAAQNERIIEQNEKILMLLSPRVVQQLPEPLLKKAKSN